MHFISLSHVQTESSSNDESAENDMVCMIYMYVQLLLHVITMAILIACAFNEHSFQSTIHINPMCVLIMATVMLRCLMCLFLLHRLQAGVMRNQLRMMLLIRCEYNTYFMFTTLLNFISEMCAYNLQCLHLMWVSVYLSALMLMVVG